MISSAEWWSHILTPIRSLKTVLVMVPSAPIDMITTLIFIFHICSSSWYCYNFALSFMLTVLSPGTTWATIWKFLFYVYHIHSPCLDGMLGFGVEISKYFVIFIFRDSHSHNSQYISVSSQCFFSVLNFCIIFGSAYCMHWLYDLLPHLFLYRQLS